MACSELAAASSIKWTGVGGHGVLGATASITSAQSLWLPVASLGEVGNAGRPCPAATASRLWRRWAALTAAPGAGAAQDRALQSALMLNVRRCPRGAACGFTTAICSLQHVSVTGAVLSQG